METLYQPGKGCYNKHDNYTYTYIPAFCCRYNSWISFSVYRYVKQTKADHMNCKLRCHRNISDIDQQMLMNNYMYYQMQDEAKDMYILGSIKTDCQQRPDFKGKKKHSWEYYLS